jgi:hypothetical protein
MMTAGMDGVEARRLRKGAVTALICAVATAVICIANLLAARQHNNRLAASYTAPPWAVRPPTPRHLIDPCAAFPFDNEILVGPSLRCPPTRALKGADYKVFQERRR